MGSSRVDKVINSICKQGCRYVNTVISESCEKSGCHELEMLSRSERSLVIKELKSVMSVYNKTGSCKA